MDYTKTVSFTGSTEKAFDLAAAALTSLGFRITTRDSSTLDLTGPGMRSTRQSALLGASRIQVTRSADELTMQAELGGVTTMRRFVTFFPTGLVLFLCIFLSIIFSLVFDDRQWVVPIVVASGTIMIVWLILGPLMARSIHSHTCSALDALLDNMAVTGNNA